TAAENGDQHKEHATENQTPVRQHGVNELQHFVQIQPEQGAHQWAEQRTGTAHHSLNDQFGGRVQVEGIRRHIALEHAKKATSQTTVGGSDDEHRQLAALK